LRYHKIEEEEKIGKKEEKICLKTPIQFQLFHVHSSLVNWGNNHPTNLEHLKRKKRRERFEKEEDIKNINFLIFLPNILEEEVGIFLLRFSRYLISELWFWRWDGKLLEEEEDKRRDGDNKIISSSSSFLFFFLLLSDGDEKLNNLSSLLWYPPCFFILFLWVFLELGDDDKIIDLKSLLSSSSISSLLLSFDCCNFGEWSWE